VAKQCGLATHLVISDKLSGDRILARLFGTHCTRMLWNYSDEWPASAIDPPRHRVCFFPEKDAAPVDVFRFAPQPAANTPRARRSRGIVFLGDVTRELPVPEGANWWKERFDNLRVASGFVFYLRDDYDRLVAEKSNSSADRRLVRVLAKNLLRLWIVEVIRKNFGSQLVLVGSNWQRFGFAANPSAYSFHRRLDYYRSAKVNLDCGSKSGDSAFYPRSSELISYAGGLLQIRCSDTDLLYGDKASEFCFEDEQTLADRIEARLVEPEQTREERDHWLLDYLRQRRLLMQDSVAELLYGTGSLQGRAH